MLVIDPHRSPAVFATLSLSLSFITVTLSPYKFRSNSDLCLTGDLRQMLSGVIAYGIQFDLNLYLSPCRPHTATYN